ncbi:hypothetical protein [Rhizobium leguminosarum]|uniref:hypothetical protein n=1 Tax=Rhizobium TaxID=379 RepID=UPI001F1F847F|nr:hypothetical protein [Rhizobium leguminosarum]UIK20894.1 hypothetical protein LZK79_31470 [Rhizobium leguminosarum]
MSEVLCLSASDQKLATKDSLHPICQLTLQMSQPLGVIEVCDVPNMPQVEGHVVCMLSNQNDFSSVIVRVEMIKERPDVCWSVRITLWHAWNGLEFRKKPRTMNFVVGENIVPCQPVINLLTFLAMVRGLVVKIAALIIATCVGVGKLFHRFPCWWSIRRWRGISGNPNDREKYLHRFGFEQGQKERKQPSATAVAICLCLSTAKLLDNAP